MTSACAGVEADRPRLDESRLASDRPLHRGDFESYLPLPGRLETVRSTRLTAPNVPISDLQMRWIEEDGAYVCAGQKVLEFDNAAFAGELEDKKLARRKEEKELLRFEAQSRAEAAAKTFAVETKQVELEKARLEA